MFHKIARVAGSGLHIETREVFGWRPLDQLDNVMRLRRDGGIVIRILCCDGNAPEREVVLHGLLVERRAGAVEAGGSLHSSHQQPAMSFSHSWRTGG